MGMGGRRMGRRVLHRGDESSDGMRVLFKVVQAGLHAKVPIALPGTGLLLCPGGPCSTYGTCTIRVRLCTSGWLISRTGRGRGMVRFLVWVRMLLLRRIVEIHRSRLLFCCKIVAGYGRALGRRVLGVFRCIVGWVFG
jgi:hypothetical protein